MSVTIQLSESRCREEHLEADALDGTCGVCLHVLVSVLEQAHQGTQAPALQHLWECQVPI